MICTICGTLHTYDFPCGGTPTFLPSAEAPAGQPPLSWEYIGEELAIFWESPYGHGKEKIASFWWPFHPPEKTAEVETTFETIAKNLCERDELRSQLAEASCVIRDLDLHNGDLRAQLSTTRSQLERVTADYETDKDAYLTASSELSTTREIARELAEELHKVLKLPEWQIVGIKAQRVLAKASAAGLLDAQRLAEPIERKS